VTPNTQERPPRGSPLRMALPPSNTSGPPTAAILENCDVDYRYAPIRVTGTNLSVDCSLCAATHLGLSLIRASCIEVIRMSAVRSPTSLVLESRSIAQAHPFAVAAVTTVGALAIAACKPPFGQEGGTRQSPRWSIPRNKRGPAPLCRAGLRNGVGLAARQRQHDSRCPSSDDLRQIAGSRKEALDHL
jgi:hypothetical protein